MYSEAPINIHKSAIKATFATLLDYARDQILHIRLLSYIRDLRKERALIKLHGASLKALAVDGFLVLENYISPKQCEAAAALLRDSFKKFPQYVRKSEDQRIFGIDNLIPCASKLASDPLFEFFASQVNREQSSCRFTLGGWLQAGGSHLA
jgi:hypothetical protein